MCFPDGQKTMQRIAGYDEAEQLHQMSDMIFDEMLKKQEKDGGNQAACDAQGVKFEYVEPYLQGAHIGYIPEKLKNDMASFDANGDGLLQKEEFFNCFVETQSISDMLWFDTDNQSEAHHEAVQQFFPKHSPDRGAAKTITRAEVEQL